MPTLAGPEIGVASPKAFTHLSSSRRSACLAIHRTGRVRVFWSSADEKKLCAR